MEETLERASWLSRMTSRFTRQADDYYYEDGDYEHPAVGVSPQRGVPSYRISVRRQVETFDDAVEAADGLREGEQQILNLNFCPPQLREKIKDWMSGLGYAVDAHWVELGENIYLIAPNMAEINSSPASPGLAARRN